MVRPNLASLWRELESAGWCWLPAASEREAATVLGGLGRFLPARRDGGDSQIFKPYSRETAPAASMSAVTGTDAQPMHTDAAYYPLPPRYIAFSCIDPGEAPCPTLVWPLDTGRVQRDRPTSLTKPEWFALGGGYRPFYCSVIEMQTRTVRMRFDPLCMQPISGSAQTTERAIDELAGYLADRVYFEWEYGALLIIDNWRCLHARGDGGKRSPSRRLQRWMIGVADGLVR
jgi:hypothetical protein